MNMIPPAQRQRGFSLIEILVTIAVVATGLLGFAGLQTYALKSNRLALQRSVATLHGYSIIDCMRANKAAAVGAEYNVDYGANILTVQTVAADDLYRWLNDLESNLPSGQGKITVGLDNSVTIKIRWKESTTQSNPYLEWSTQTTL